MDLLAKLQWQPAHDRVILVGDLVGKGNASRKRSVFIFMYFWENFSNSTFLISGPEVKNVINFCRRLQLECVMGNFEVKILKLF